MINTILRISERFYLKHFRMPLRESLRSVWNGGPHAVSENDV